MGAIRRKTSVATGRMTARFLAARALAGLMLLSACHPVVVKQGETASVEIGVPAAEPSLNVLGIGTPGPDGTIVLRGSGVILQRGSTVTLGVMGPGMVQGTAIGIVGIGFGTRIVRYGVTQGGAQQPVIVLSLSVPQSAEPGLYSVVAVRGTEIAVLAGALEIT